MTEKCRAYLVDYGDVQSVVIATTRNRARRKVQLAARDVGLRGDWIEIRVRRLPGYDLIGDALQHETGPMTLNAAKGTYLALFGRGSAEPAAA